MLNEDRKIRISVQERQGPIFHSMHYQDLSQCFAYEFTLHEPRQGFVSSEPLGRLSGRHLDASPPMVSDHAVIILPYMLTDFR